jgi:D-alanyl-D-alanine carboxypeptidase
MALAGCGAVGLATPIDIPGPSFKTPSATEAPADSAIVGSSPTVAPEATPASAEALALQALLDGALVSSGAPGAMAVLRRDGREVRVVSGNADANGTPITPTTRFRIASNTKPITAALVLDAVARGALSLDDVVGELLPGVVRADPPVTVRQLLSHTSGIFDEINQPDIFADIPNLTDPALRAEAEDIATRYQAGERVILPDRVIVALSETHDRYFQPGTGYHYSNTNYQLAAMILEKTIGRSLSEILQAGIVDPLGLTHTTLLPPDTASPEFRGYVRSSKDGSLVDITDDLLIFGNGGPGGIITTPEELLTMLQAIVSGRLLPARLVAEMKKPIRNFYGLGLSTYDLSCGTFFGHEGATNGTASIVLASGQGDAGLVIALNLRGQSDPNLVALADQMLCERP